MKRKLILGIMAVCTALPALGLSMPWEWNFGKTGDQKVLTTTITILNDEKTAASVKLVSPCGCLTLSPAELSLRPGERATVAIAFDPAGYWGEVEKDVLVRSGGANGIFVVHGFITPVAPVPDYSGECEWCKKQSEENRRAAYASWRNRPTVIRYYYSKGCTSCSDFIASEVPRVSAIVGKTIEVDALDIGVPGYLTELDGLLAGARVELRTFPVLKIGGTILQGEQEIKAHFEEAARKALK
jgi:hypothetical protein